MSFRQANSSRRQTIWRFVCAMGQLALHINSFCSVVNLYSSGTVIMIIAMEVLLERLTWGLFDTTQYAK